MLTTLAVTVFGAMIAWLIPRDLPAQGSALGAFVFIASTLLTLVLFALFLLTHQLTEMLRIFTTYLDETDVSNWEKDWSAYRSQFRYLGYTRPQAMIFLLLGIISSGFPFLLWVAYTVELEPRAGAISCIVIGILYAVFVCGMGLSKWFAKESKIRRKWKKLKDS